MRFWQLTLVVVYCLLAGCIGARRKKVYLKRPISSRQSQELLPLFRALNEFVDAITDEQTLKVNKQDEQVGVDVNDYEVFLNEKDNHDFVTDVENGEGMSTPEKVKPRRKLKKPPKLMLVKTKARDNSDSGRTLKHLFILKGLAGGLAGSSSGYTSGAGNGGYTIPYIIINNPTNVTNLNNNNLTNVATAGTGTGTGTGGGRILMPQAMIMPVQVPSENPIRRYEQRQKGELLSAANMAATLPTSTAAFMNFQGNVIPLPMLQNIPRSPTQIQRLRKAPQQQTHSYNIFSFLGNGFKGIEYL